VTHADQSTQSTAIPAEHRADVETLWDYHNMHHELRPCDVGIGLGSHDLGVATYTAELYQRGLVPRILFTGANAPTTIDRFPRGEAVHYREEALRLGVPDDDILIETHAENTGQNITLSREVLKEHGIEVRSVIFVSRPYQQRRVYATVKLIWPEIDVLCMSRPMPIDDYLATIGDTDLVINTIVGDTQRIEEYARIGYAIPQPMPDSVKSAFSRLASAGYTRRFANFDR
jgi:uncharacterized SAM-binding protein YcdF (DUF218 family)